MPEVTQEELDLLNNYRSLGTVDQIKGTVAGFQQIARQQTISEAARLTGFKPAVLEKLSGGLGIVIKDSQAFVKTEAGEVAMSEYAESEWKDFIPSLKVEAETKGQTYVAYVPQPSKGVDAKLTGNKLVSNYITRTYGAKQAVTN